MMPVAYVQEFPVDPGGDRTTTNYDAIAARVNAAASPPEGLIVHTAGFDEDAGVFRIFDVWETQGHARSFLDERLLPLVREIAPDAPPPSREYLYELHDVAGG
jgi:hypothetical protein